MTLVSTNDLLRALGRATAPLYRHHRYRWAWGPLDARLTAEPLPDGFELVEAGEAELPLLQQADAGFPRARDFLAAGHRLWMVRNGDRLAFSGWTFIGSAPADASRTGWVSLPDGVINAEDATAHPDVRGRGFAAMSWALVAARLARERVASRMITGYLDTNASSRHAVAKSGLREFAVVDVTKVGLLPDDAEWRMRHADGPLCRTRVRVRRPGADGTASPTDLELFGWLRTAVRAGVPGPAAGAGAWPA